MICKLLSFEIARKGRPFKGLPFLACGRDCCGKADCCVICNVGALAQWESTWLAARGLWVRIPCAPVYTFIPPFHLEGTFTESPHRTEPEYHLPTTLKKRVLMRLHSLNTTVKSTISSGRFMLKRRATPDASKEFMVSHQNKLLQNKHCLDKRNQDNALSSPNRGEEGQIFLPFFRNMKMVDAIVAGERGLARLFQ